MTPLCAFVDDSVDEANALANQLKRKGVPFDIRPVYPARTTSLTYYLITNAKPCAAMVDYCLTASPGTKSEDLARRLLDHGLPTVIVTKDRDIADRGNIRCNGQVIPVYSKQRLIGDTAYVAQFIQSLGGSSKHAEETDYTERLHVLQERAFRSVLSQRERGELRTLTARLELEESVEAARIEKAQSSMKQNVDSLIETIRELTADLNNELKANHAVSTPKRRSQTR